MSSKARAAKRTRSAAIPTAKAKATPTTRQVSIPSPVAQMARLLDSEEALDDAAREQDLHGEPEADPREFFELTEAGYDGGETDPEGLVEFEAAPSRLPRMRQLPAAARPRVLFWLDSKFEVHSTTRGTVGPYAEKASAIVRAIALHMSRFRASRLSFDGDWVTVPVVQGLDELRLLLQEVLGDNAKAEDVLYWVGKRTGMLRSFAFHLPNGDTVTPQALISPALKGGTRVGAAAIRRLSSQWHPSGQAVGLLPFAQSPGASVELAGETLNEAEWDSMLKMFNKAARQHKRRIAKDA